MQLFLLLSVCLSLGGSYRTIPASRLRSTQHLQFHNSLFHSSRRTLHTPLDLTNNKRFRISNDCVSISVSTSSSMESLEGAPQAAAIITGFWNLVRGNWLIIGEIFVIWLAHLYPQLGATGGPLRPEFTVSKLGVFTIFFINGVALSPPGESTVAERAVGLKVNTLIQLYNFAFIPIVLKVIAPLYPDAAFRDGLLVLACLPTTINICVAQTLAAGGSMGTAIFNAIFANVLGVFLTPTLAILMLGAGKGVSLISTLSKLWTVVILPLALGQLARRTPIGAFMAKVNKNARTLSSCLLLAIVYNVFSDTFMKGIGVSGSALIKLIIAMPILYLTFCAIFWKLIDVLIPGLDPPNRTAALLASSQKTLAFGIPFIKTALGTRPDIAYVLAPLLMYAPAQLLLGSAVLVPALRKWMDKSEMKIQTQGGGI